MTEIVVNRNNGLGKNVPREKRSLQSAKNEQKQTTTKIQNQQKSKTFHRAVKPLFTVSIKKRLCFLKQRSLYV